MKTLLLVSVAILGVLGGPAISNDQPEFLFLKKALAIIDRSAGAGQSSMEKLFVQAAASTKDLKTIAWNEIHPEFEGYADALGKLNRGLKKAVATGKLELQPQERQELIALTAEVIKARKGSDNVAAVASQWASIYNTLSKIQDKVVGAIPAVVTFCIDQGFFGDCTDMIVEDGCNPMPSGFDDDISSANTHGGCVIVYQKYDSSDGDCQGDSMTLSDSLGTGYIGDFDDYDFNDEISAVANC